MEGHLRGGRNGDAVFGFDEEMSYTSISFYADSKAS